LFAKFLPLLLRELLAPGYFSGIAVHVVRDEVLALEPAFLQVAFQPTLFDVHESDELVERFEGLAEQTTGIAGVREFSPFPAADAGLSLLALTLVPVAVTAVWV
jgi:hypothetical protein